MPKYEKKNVSEQQLEDIVRRFPDYIESGEVVPFSVEGSMATPVQHIKQLYLS